MKTHSQGISRLPCSSDKLGENVELDFDSCRCEDDARRNGEENRQGNTEEYGADTGLGRPSCDRGDA